MANNKNKKNIKKTITTTQQKIINQIMPQINTSSRVTARSKTNNSLKQTHTMKWYFIWGLFTCSLLHCVYAAVAVNDARFVYNKSKTDTEANSAENADANTNVKLLEENETDPVSNQQKKKQKTKKNVN